jgi:hypothetical protein
MRDSIPASAEGAAVRKRDVDVLPTAFLRTWVRQHYFKDGQDAHAENTRRDAKEMRQLTRMGVHREFKKKRDRKKH